MGAGQRSLCEAPGSVGVGWLEEAGGDLAAGKSTGGGDAEKELKASMIPDQNPQKVRTTATTSAASGINQTSARLHAFCEAHPSRSIDSFVDLLQRRDGYKRY